MFNRENHLGYDVLTGAHKLWRGQPADFSSYFNALSIAKWKKYTKAHSFALHLNLRGRVTVQLQGSYAENGLVRKEFFTDHTFVRTEPGEIVLPIAANRATVVSFMIESFDDAELYGGYYTAEIDEDELNPVELDIVTTTFQKEAFITDNLALFESALFNGGEELAAHLYVNVIDNGRTLDPEAFNNAHTHVFPNPNVGGSGGYTRGMIESLHSDRHPTHILLMDDDVVVQPESIFRTYALLRLVKDEYKDHFISGAMLSLEEMHMQHEDVGYVSRATQGYGPEKPRLELHYFDNVVLNEADYSADRPDRYAGWWYCCIPTTIARLDNLPLPLFVRGDDVEYSLRNNAQFITLGGICIWHAGFTFKFSAAMELYQVHRNSMMIQAMSDILPGVDFTARIKRLLWVELCRFSYDAADQLLDSLEDYLSGPDFIATPTGERLLKAHSAKNEQLVNLARFSHPPVKSKALYAPKKARRWLHRQLYRLTINGHLAPKFLLKKGAPDIAFDWFNDPQKNFFHRHLLAINPYAQTAILRTLDQKRGLAIIQRSRALFKRHAQENAALVAAYRAAREKFVTEAFWLDYLQQAGALNG
ncbi:MAG: glycosyltransferase [Oscillospiraceae bacterium]|jgi:GT2 family glycosyltransferase|nr:glycosyltransferase [Oscillospiraceae bacterium]